MGNVFTAAYGERSELLADLKAALELEGLDTTEASAFCDAVAESSLVAHGRGIVGYEYPTSTPGQLSMLIPVPVLGYGLVFNGKNAAVKLGISAFGVLIGGPLAFLSVLQNVVGYDFALLDFESGKVCNLATLLDANTPLTPETLTQETSGKPCARPKSDCHHRIASMCAIELGAVHENLVRLEEKKAVIRISDAFSANRL